MKQDKILIVDDNRDLALGMEIRLRANGYDTLRAEDGPEAIRLALLDKPYAITLDLSLPRESGLVVLEKLRQMPELSSIPVIVVSGDDSQLTDQTVRDLGIMAVLNKPVSHQLLLLLLAEISHSESPKSASDITAGIASGMKQQITGPAARSTLPALPDKLAQAIVRGWQESILVLNLEMRVEFANEFFCKAVGMPWSKMDGQLLGDLLGSPKVSEFLSDVLSGSAAHDCETPCHIQGIGNRVLLLSASLLLHSDLPTILLRISDVSNRNLSNRALTRKVEVAEREEAGQRREADLLRSIMESSGDGIFVADVEGNCVLWNGACEEILGVIPENLEHLKMVEWTEFLGVYLDDKVTPYPVRDLPLSRALAGEVCDNVELWIRNKARPDGLWISVTARPLMGGQEGAMSTIRDITFARAAKHDLADLAEEVDRSNRELEQFAYVAAHDLQEPLRMVSSYVQLLAKRYQGNLDSEADEFIGYVVDGSKRMSQLINDLLSYSRIGRGEVTEEVVDCEQVLEQVLYSLSQKNNAAGAAISHDPLPKITANEVQITQVLQNLIDNGVKFRGKDNPRVHVSAREQASKWVFSVADNGIGIDQKYKDKVFVIFQRLNTREEYGGTGIGLAVVKKIVEKRGGEVWVEPNHGHGTIVYFTWPQTIINHL